MEIKKIKALSCILILFLFWISFVNAEGVGNSRKGIKYDLDILDDFNFTNIEKEYFRKGDFLDVIPKKEVEWVHVMVKIKDTTGIVIPHRNSLDFEAKLKERNEIMIKLTNLVLATLSSEEFQFESKSEFGGIFSGNITKEGFERLLKDTCVKKIYAEKDIHTSLTESAPLINADDAWSSGYDGTEQTVCVIDTGINYSHPDLGGCLGGGCKVKGGYDYGESDADPMDFDGHGTYVAGIVASEDSTVECL